MPGSFGVLLDVDFLATDLRTKTLCNLGFRSQILADCGSNVFQRFLARRALAVAAWKLITPNRETLL
jgi:hypothetical protein